MRITYNVSPLTYQTVLRFNSQLWSMRHSRINPQHQLEIDIWAQNIIEDEELLLPKGESK